MNRQKRCPKCGYVRYWKIRRGKRKCVKCRYEYPAKNTRLSLTRKQWREIIKWFVLEQSIDRIVEQTYISRYQVIKALTHIRRLMLMNIPEVFEGIVEVDETYIGGQWKNKRKAKKIIGTKRGRGTSKQPVFGILCRGGKVWAEVVPNVEAKTLLPLLKKRVRRGSIVCTDTFKSYTGVAARGYIHRLVNHNEGEYSRGGGNHINGLEGFWGYLKRKLASKGGIRREKQNLYLSEYVWRYNNRDLNVKQKVNALLRLVFNANEHFLVAKI